MVMQIIAQGLCLGATLALSALGLTIIYGVMGVVNLAHGEFLMLGAYGMALLSPLVGPWVALVLTPVLVGLIGAVADRTLIRWLYHDPVKSMLGTFGLSLVLSQLVQLLEGPGLRYVGVPLSGSVSIGFGEHFPLWRVFLIAAALIVGIGLMVWFSRSATGLKMRTTTVDPEIAASLGMNVSRVNAIAFAVGTALAGLGGALIAPLDSVYPTMGVAYLVPAFLVVILAGLSSIRKALIWAAAIGIFTDAIAVPYNDVLAQAIVWSAALLLIALRRQTVVASRV